MLNRHKSIICLGIITFILLSITFILGITQSPEIIHHYFATSALIFACLHLGFIIYPKFKREKKK